MVSASQHHDVHAHHAAHEERSPCHALVFATLATRFLHAVPLRLLAILAQLLQPDVPILGWGSHGPIEQAAHASAAHLCVCLLLRPTRLRPSTPEAPDGASLVQSSCGLP